MNNKTYTIKRSQFKETSRFRGTIDYYLVDEKGTERVVNAVAKLGLTKKVKSIRARYYRESPLVKVISKAENNQRVTVSYSKFNKKPRISLSSSGRGFPAAAVTNESSMFNEESGSFFSKLFRA